MTSEQPREQRQPQEVDVARIDHHSNRLRGRTLAGMLPVLGAAVLILAGLLLAVSHIHSTPKPARPATAHVPQHPRRRLPRRAAHRVAVIAPRPAPQHRTASRTPVPVEAQVMAAPVVSSSAPTEAQPPPAPAPRSASAAGGESLANAEEEFGFER